MVELYFIRHGRTYGNTRGRYIGTTDEGLCAEGLSALREGRFPRVDCVYASPMKRCVETALAIWPERRPLLCEKLRECDFGEFENKSYRELDGNPSYQAWVDSGGRLPFPGGESHEAFQERCREGFLWVLADIRKRLAEKNGDCVQKNILPAPDGQKERQGCAEAGRLERKADFSAALVVHGGTIMSILEAYAKPSRDFYDWQVKNGRGWRACWDERDEGGIRLYDVECYSPYPGVSAGSVLR